MAISLLFLLVPFYDYTNNFHNKFFPSFLVKENFKLEKKALIYNNIYSKNEWVVQFNVAQYSSILVEQVDGSVDIEALIFHDNTTKSKHIRNNTKCLILEPDEKMLEFEPFEILTIDAEASIWLIKCKINNRKILNNSNSTVAIIDKNDFENSQNRFEHLIVKSQKPSIFKRSVPKKKQISHCVHLIYNLDETRLQNLIEWISIQRQLNIAKIRLYFHKVSDPIYAIRKIREANNDEKFVEVIYYKNELKDFCQIKTNFRNSNQFSSDNCDKSFKIHFSKSTQKHEKINTNDCYLNYKYEYEYVSNYDFDEFIFPRSYHKIDQIQLLDLFSHSQQKNNNCLSVNYSMPYYDLYNYTRYLQDMLGGSSVAYLQFDNTFMLLKYRNILDKILKYTSGYLFEYHKDNRSIKFTVSESDKELVRNFQNVIPIIDCLNETNRIKMKSDFYKSKWNNAYSLRTIFRLGKSIFVTDNTLTVNVHGADNVLPGTKYKTVPLDYGFVSHFRNDFDLDSESKTHVFSLLKFDLEYYLFFSKSF